MNNKLIRGLTAVLDSDGWKYDACGDAVRMTVHGCNGIYVFVARELNGQLACYSHLPFPIPPSQRSVAAEYLCRANWGMRLGNFELELDKGIVRYKTVCDAGDGTLPDEVVRHAVVANLATIDRYVPGLLAVMCGAASPPDAIEAIESPSPREETTASN